jgi:hypothetical protein
MVDCAGMMDEVRWVKTEGEIRLLMKGDDLLDDAYLGLSRHQAGRGHGAIAPTVPMASATPAVLEEGMVSALEPAKECYHVQDTVVGRARGPEWISDKFNTDRMFAID